MSRTYTKGIDLYEAQVARFRAVRMSAEQAFAEIARHGYRDHIELSSGQLGPEITKGAFARGRTPGTRGGFKRQRGRLDPLPINVQSGRLRRSLRLDRIGRMAFNVTNNTPYAGFVLEEGGTRLMIDRGFRKEIRKRYRARIKAFRDAFRKAHK